MPLRRARNARNVQSKEELSREMRHSKLTLFIQQFEKEAQERMNELEAKMENMLATVEKVFKVELMKMPPALQNTLIGDLISGKSSLIMISAPSLKNTDRLLSLTEEEVSASEVSIAMKVSWVSSLNCTWGLYFYFPDNHQIHFHLLQSELREMPQPLRRMPSKRGERRLFFFFSF
uniref:Borealin N-terminal domain-containing protein n=1 Tax=Amphilophus citrinellus TaxID=61819 RepID=A0A3Q0T9R3_AMPCI